MEHTHFSIVRFVVKRIWKHLKIQHSFICAYLENKVVFLFIYLNEDVYAHIILKATKNYNYI